jgi:dolichyl-phosphate-mannose-protein mannosyltransferase
MASESIPPYPQPLSPQGRGASVVRRAVLLALLAVLYTGLNALKPLHIDDTAYSYYSAQAAAHPLDPYCFQILWYYQPEPANEVIAPPVLPYWWALSRALFGERPWLWKLALLPWCLLLVWALHALLRRFAAGLELPLTVMTVLSPALLPSLNLMLDVPALALSLASVHLFLAACDRDSFARAALSGLVAGLAMETKYTGAVAPAVMLLAAATTGRWRLWPAAALAAAQVFVTWELLIALLYGRSHFLQSLDTAAAYPLSGKGALFVLFFSFLGGTAPFLFVLGLAALGVRRRWLAAAVAVVLAGFALVALLDAHFWGDVRPSPRLFGDVNAPKWDFPGSEVVFEAFAAGGAVVTAVGVRRLWAGGPEDRRDTLFLALWLALEAVAYYPLTPFPATRRILGPLVVLTLLLGRLAARAWPSPRQRRAAWLWAACTAALGLGYFALDAWEAYAEERGAEQAAAWVAGHGGGRTWYVGHYGFQYYAERCGMIPAYAAPDPAESPLLRAGDWLVRPEPPVASQEIDLGTPALREEVLLIFDDPVPLRTVSCFYCGRAPLEHHEGPRLTVHIYRVVEDFRPK